MTSNEIRHQFLDFFRSKGHQIVDSSPVVPLDDPSLMFTNAGMNQFKDVFLGVARPPYVRAADTQKCIRAGGKHNDLDDVGQDTYHHTFFEMLGNWSFGDYFKKEAIEWAWELLTKVWRIPKNRLHATYFEGDPHERLDPDAEAADLWRTVTDIHPDHVHPGSKKDNFWEMGDTGPCGPCSEIHIDLTPDCTGTALVNAGDARVIELWNLVFIQFAASWLPGGAERMGEWDRTGSGDRKAKFGETNREKVLASCRELSPLPARHVDTGMGFERLCAVLQGMQCGHLGGVTNYDTDVFTPIFDAIRQRTGAPAYTATLPTNSAVPPSQGSDSVASPLLELSRLGRGDASQGSDSVAPSLHEAVAPPLQGGDGGGSGVAPVSNRCGHDQVMIDVSYRVIADHIRCLMFALTDGAVPSNEGRGYVLRRILRRAVRYGRQYMNMHEPFLCDLVKPLVDHMGDAFPELRLAHGGKNVRHVCDIIRDEEDSFGRTFDRGLKLYRQETDFARKHHLGRISGEAAFKLHDTFGFTIDLAERMAEEDKLTIDIGEYERLMQEAREKARPVHGMMPMSISGAAEHHPDTIFTGYDAPDTRKPKVNVLAIYTGEEFAESRPDLREGQRGALVLSKTPFYAEQGGQISDRGVIRGKRSSWTFQVEDTQKVRGVYFHIGKVSVGTVQTAGSSSGAAALVDAARRIPTMKNHTSTHILNWALREVLGDHVRQKGSLVDPEKTRFDFSHNKPLSDDEIQRIDQLVNERIVAGLPVYAAGREEDFIDQQQARQISTLRAVFGEKYPDRVRVVSIGAPVTEQDAKRAGESDWLLKSPENPKWMNYSVEFCGGTHVKNTREIESFVLVGEEGVAKGIRRIVGISGDAAQSAVALGETLLAEANALLEQSRADQQSRDCEGAVAPPLYGAVAAPSEAVAPPLQADDSVAPPLQGGDGGGSGVPPASSRCNQDFPQRLADLQKKLALAVIPVCVRAQINDIIADLQKRAKDQQKQQAAAFGEAVHQTVATLLQNAETIAGVTVLLGQVPPANAQTLRSAIDWVRNKTTASAVLLAAATEGKVTLIAGMSKDVVARGVKAGDLIKEICPIVGGRGGGRPDMAQGGGCQPDKIGKAIDAATIWVKRKLA